MNLDTKEQNKIIHTIMNGIISALPDLACIIDATGHIICANEAFQLLIKESETTVGYHNKQSFYYVLSDSCLSTFQETIKEVFILGTMKPCILADHKNSKTTSQWSINRIHALYENYPDVVILNGKLSSSKCLSSPISSSSSFLHTILDDAVHKSLNSPAIKRIFANPFTIKNKIYAEETTTRHVEYDNKCVPKVLLTCEGLVQQQQQPSVNNNNNTNNNVYECTSSIPNMKLHAYAQEGNNYTSIYVELLLL
jgi:hypothetical protein